MVAALALKLKGGKDFARATEEERTYQAVQRELALMYQMRTPNGLSLRAQWMERRPPSIPSWDWWLLYDDDKELWPFIIELAKEEYGA